MATKKPTQKKNTQSQSIPSIKARIDNLVEFDNSPVRAFASITVGGHFAIHGFVVCESDEGKLSVLCPATKSQKDGKYYDNAHPISAAARTAMNDAITNAYEEKLEEVESEDEDEGEDEGVSQSM